MNPAAVRLGCSDICDGICISLPDILGPSCDLSELSDRHVSAVSTPLERLRPRALLLQPAHQLLHAEADHSDKCLTEFQPGAPKCMYPGGARVRSGPETRRERKAGG